MSETPSDPGQDPGAAQDVLTWLSTWIGTVLNDFLRLLADGEAALMVLPELGWEGTAPALPATLLGRLDQSGQAGSDPGAQQGESFLEVITALGLLTEAMVASASSGDGDGGVTALELVADALDLVAMGRMRREHPGVWAVLRLLSLLSDDGAELDNLSRLVGDSQQYLSGLVSGPGFNQAYQNYSAAILGAIGTGLALIPSSGTHGHDQTSFRSEVLYGWTPAGPTDHPSLMDILERTMTWRIDNQRASDSNGPAVEQTVDLTVALVPGEHNDGHWGVFLRMAGATSLSIPLGAPKKDADSGQSTPTGWQLTLSSSDGVAVEILAAANGFIRGTAAGFKASVALERPDDVSGSWVIGAADKSHVEIQHARAAITVSDEADGPLLDVGLQADHFIVDLDLAGDSFLGAVLPPSLRLDTKIGLGIDTARGFYLNGGVALVVDLPVNATIGPSAVLDLVLQALHLRIGFTTDDSHGATPSDSSFTVAFSVDVEVQVAGGIFQATVAGIGVAFEVTQMPGPSVTAVSGAGGGQTASPSGPPATAGHWQPSLDFVPPDGLGVVIKAGPVTGGGYIGYDASSGEYTGALQLKLGVGDTGVGITALGMLDTRIAGHDDDWALLILLAVTFSPGLPLGFGINLSGVGGVLGINHTIDGDAIAAGLRTHSLDAILFPPDPVAQAPHIFAVWRQTMPIAVGHTVVGPMIRLGWGGGAGTNLCTLELAVLIDFTSDPFGIAEIVLLGSFVFSAPTSDIGLVRLEADVLGRMTFDPLDFLLQAELVNSRLGTFIVSGGLVILARGGPNSAYVMSVGGFHPKYAVPCDVPVADRIRVDISGSDNPRLRIEAYLAITSQTFQFGARVELHAAAGPLALDGWLSLDVLIAWLPHFHFTAEISAGLSLSYDGSPVLEISIDVLLEGPGPWHIKGYASLTLLFFTLSLPVDASWGEDAGPTAPSCQPLTLLGSALAGLDAWTASLPAGSSSIVILRQPTGDVVPAHPLASISCHQRVAPLGLAITHMGNQPLDAPTTVDVAGLTLGGVAATGTTEVDDLFAAGEFLDLTDDQALSRPSFESMRAGLAAGADAVDVGNATVVATTYKTIAVDGATRTQLPRWRLSLGHADSVLRPSAPATARPFPVVLTLGADTMRSFAGEAGGPQTATLAAQRAGGGRLLDAVGIAGVAA